MFNNSVFNIQLSHLYRITFPKVKKAKSPSVNKKTELCARCLLGNQEIPQICSVLFLSSSLTFLVLLIIAKQHLDGHPKTELLYEENNCLDPVSLAFID